MPGTRNIVRKQFGTKRAGKREGEGGGALDGTDGRRASAVPGFVAAYVPAVKGNDCFVYDDGAVLAEPQIREVVTAIRQVRPPMVSRPDVVGRAFPVRPMKKGPVEHRAFAVAEATSS